MTKTFKTMSDANSYFLKEQLSRDVDFMLKYQLNANQMFLLKLFLFEEYVHLYKHVERLNKTEKKNLSSDILDLYEKGIVSSKWIQLNSDYPDQIKITDEFLESVLNCFGIDSEFYLNLSVEKIEKNKFIANFGEQFFDIYPTSVNGYILKACNSIEFEGKIYTGKSDIVKLYCEQINYDLNKHKEVIEKIKYDNSAGNQVCRISITKFVRDKLWDSIKLMKWEDNV